jgi:hypothetical protein
MRITALLVLAACGVQQPAVPKAVAPPPKPLPAIATCSDVGVILRGDVEDANDVGAKAKEQAIARACSEDVWAQSVIDCVASTTKPQDCIDKLTEKQLDAFGRRIDAWRDKFGADSSGGVGMQLQVDCSRAIVDTTVFTPPIAASSDEAVWQVDQRTHLLEEACEHDFSEELKQCLAVAASSANDVDACMKQGLTQDEYDALTKQLAHISDVARAIVATKQKPPAYECSKVVAKLYGEAAWKQRLDGFKPKDRKRMITESRKLMTAACPSWEANTRACVIAGGEAELCFDDENRARWGYPAIGAVVSVDIEECDDYSAAVLRFTNCNMLGDAARKSIQRSQQQLLAQIARLPATERATMGTSCKAGMDAVNSALADAGC